jgi:hypothetical protein
MLAALVGFPRMLGLLCRGHRAVVLENVALRQQLSVLRRTVRRPHLRTSDRLFWILLAKTWQDWRTALIVVQPDTVMRWHRQWLRRRWTQRSTRTRASRPSTAAAIRTVPTEYSVPVEAVTVADQRLIAFSARMTALFVAETGEAPRWQGATTENTERI